MITPDGVADAALDRVLREGARVFGPKFSVQARAKSRPGDLVRVAELSALLAAELGFDCFVNGDVDLAERLGLSLHVPSSMRSSLSAERLAKTMHSAHLSRPAHHEDDVRGARDDGTYAILVSPIYDVPGKGPPRGVEALTRAKLLAPELHVVALGGVTSTTAQACFAAGADAVAVMRGPFETEPGAFFEALESARARHCRTIASRDAKP